MTVLIINKDDNFYNIIGNTKVSIIQNVITINVSEKI